jgi:hypothetical protein
MKNKFFSFAIAAFSLLLVSCPNISSGPVVECLWFEDDHTIGYLSSTDNNESCLCYTSRFSIEPRPSEKYEILYSTGGPESLFTFGTAKMKIKFNRDIPDGSLVTLYFHEKDDTDIVCTCYVVKSTEPKLVSIKFVDDKTINYQFSWTSDGSKEKDPYYKVKSVTVTPDNNYSVKENYFIDSYHYLSKIVFDKPIPDGSTITIDFVDKDENPVCTHSFVKSR